jgi:hypothetical protein
MAATECLKEWGYTRFVIRASAADFELTIDQLKQLAAPVIVFVQPLGYKRFAVLRGIDRSGMWTPRTGGAPYVPHFRRVSSDAKLASKAA